MDIHSDPSVSEDELHALLDGRLGPDARAALEQRLARDPGASARLEAWQRQHEAVRALYGDMLEAPVPPALLAAAGQAERSHRDIQHWWKWGGVAAGLAFAFGLGWVTHVQWTAQFRPLLVQRPAHEFVHQAALAYAVYAPEVRHPVEVDSAQEAHLVQWLSKRLGRPLKTPRLDAQGYSLMGGRLLPGDEGARAQFMYQNARGERITLYLGMPPAGTGQQGERTEFRYSADGPVPSFYWVDAGFAYALSGTLTRQQLLELAQAVYHQL